MSKNTTVSLTLQVKGNAGAELCAPPGDAMNQGLDAGRHQPPRAAQQAAHRVALSGFDMALSQLPANTFGSV